MMLIRKQTASNNCLQIVVKPREDNIDNNAVYNELKFTVKMATVVITGAKYLHGVMCLKVAPHAPGYACSKLLAASDLIHCVSNDCNERESCDATRYETTLEEL